MAGTISGTGSGASSDRSRAGCGTVPFGSESREASTIPAYSEFPAQPRLRPPARVIGQSRACSLVGRRWYHICFIAHRRRMVRDGIARTHVWKYTCRVPQLSIYLDNDTAQKLDEAAERQGMSRSALAAEAIRRILAHRLPDEWFALYGSWEDDREPEEILRDIRAGTAQPDRPPLS